MGNTPLNVHEMLIDLKGAARLGAPEALDMALAALDGWPAFVANAHLRDEDVLAVLVPLGEVLALPTVPEAYLLALAEHPLTGGRALAAAALAQRALRGGKVPAKALRRLAADKRAEVRLAAAEVLRRRGATAPQALLALLRDWLMPGRSPRLLATAVHVAAALGQAQPEDALALLARLTPEQRQLPEIQRALGDTLRQIAAAGQGAAVLALLEGWQDDGFPVEAVLRALRGEWARAHRPRADALLDAVEARTGVTRALRRARQFLHAPAGEARP